MDRKLGKVYEKNLDKPSKKAMGKYYTPQYIIDYILGKTLARADIVNNPFVSVIDISCGAGYFLLSAYDLLMAKFLENLSNLREAYGHELYIIRVDRQGKEIRGRDYWKAENLPYHILKHCIYGADKDRLAVELTRQSLYKKGKVATSVELNILHCDSLIRWENKYMANLSYETKGLKDFWEKKYDYVVGNPPYIGHKQLDMEYKRWLLREYGEVFKDKSDISFAFIKRIFEILSDNGISGIITSRYFMENPSGRELRGYFAANGNILEIVDFYGASIFKGVGVATAIYIFGKDIDAMGPINVYKLDRDNHRFIESENLSGLVDTGIFESFTVSRNSLGSDRWTLLSRAKQKIYQKLHAKAGLRLGDIAYTFQGVITGRDSAFVLTKNLIDEYAIEEDLIKRWIKNSDIDRYNIGGGDLFLIYSDLIGNERDYPNALEYISHHRERLENRRECKKGSRKWYELQWGRKSSLFEQVKLVFPYKAQENRFALDRENNYFSADIYSMVVKDEYKYRIQLEYLLGLLNSSIYEFYFKLFAKKIARGMYDYYPNTILDIKIISGELGPGIKKNVEEILEFKSNMEDGNKLELNKLIQQNQREIDKAIAFYLGLNLDELEIISRSVNRDYNFF
ncbi:MAG: N-6 DNA methylase [Tissierellaceae bacterium]